MRIRVARGLLLVFGTLVGLGIGEIAVRLSGHGREAMAFDPRFEVGNDRWIFDFEVPPGAGTVQIREQVIPVKKRADETRVLFVGDSGTKGSYVPITQSFPLQFKALLDEKDPQNHVNVINAGVWGMTTVDEYHLLRDKLLPLKPDVVVLGLFMANDINFNLAHTRKQLRSSPWLDALRAHSALARFVFLRFIAINDRYRLIDAGANWAPVEARLIDSHGLHLLNYPAGELATYMSPESAAIDEAYEILADLLTKFRRLGEQHGFRFRVLLIPTPSSVAGELRILRHPDILDELASRGVKVDSSGMDFAEPTRRVLELCGDLDIPCIDPTARMKKAGPGVFFPADEHPSPLGHRILAKALFSVP